MQFFFVRCGAFECVSKFTAKGSVSVCCRFGNAGNNTTLAMGGGDRGVDGSPAAEGSSISSTSGSSRGGGDGGRAPLDDEHDDLRRLFAVLGRHRLRAIDDFAVGRSGLLPVRSDHVLPDPANRERTGVSVEHVHFLAGRFLREGFRARPRCDGAEGHEIPVLVLEDADSAQGRLAIERWRAATAADATLPQLPSMPVVHTTSTGARHFFTSLGNGHFTQALNLFRQGDAVSRHTGAPFRVPPGAAGAALRRALDEGVPALVLSGVTITPAERKLVSGILNAAHAHRWGVDPRDGRLVPAGDDESASQFERISKTLDATELSSLVRTTLGSGYRHPADHGAPPSLAERYRPQLSRL